MRQILHFATSMLLLLPTAASPVPAGEVIDSVVVTVNHKPIFRSEWDDAVCYESFMQGRPVTQLTEDDRVKALQRLIDRQLLEAQMGDAYPLQPSEDELKNTVMKLRAQLPDGNSDQSWQKLLARYNLTEELLKEHLRVEAEVMNFVEVRLRPNVHVQPEEIEGYYQRQLLPELEKAGGGKVVSFEKVEPRIRELLAQQHMDELLEAWLYNLRQQAEIRTTVPIPALRTTPDQPRASGAN